MSWQVFMQKFASLASVWRGIHFFIDSFNTPAAYGMADRRTLGLGMVWDPALTFSTPRPPMERRFGAHLTSLFS